jgi:hypothetical protein
MHPFAPRLGLVALFLAFSGAKAAVTQAHAQCPSEVDPDAVISQAQLEQQLAVLAGLGLRPTGSDAHHQLIAWIRQQLDQIPSIQRREQSYPIRRWLETHAELSAGTGSVPVSSAVPYSGCNDVEDVHAQMVYVPSWLPISMADVGGKIIVREAPLRELPLAGYLALAWFRYDPDNKLLADPLATIERDVMATDKVIDDLEEAEDKSAAGIIYMHDFPHEQMIGHYAPYEGLRWAVPGFFVGVEERDNLTALAQQGAWARMRMQADVREIQTPNVIATLPGLSPARIVLNSHTDGANALQDNGPLAMLAIARYFAALPIACRPKTLQFNFPTAHVYQYLVGGEREGGAEQIAKQLDIDFEQGTVAYVLSLEHLGAREYQARSRPNGLAGRELVQTGEAELQMIFVSTSSTLLSEVGSMLERHDNRGSIVMRGADLPGPHLPVHRSFAGEGTPYHRHLLPTVGYIAAPWSAMNPRLNLEAVDPVRMHEQTVMFADFIQRTAPLTVNDLAGGVRAERAARKIACDEGVAGEGTHCPGQSAPPVPPTGCPSAAL